MNSEFEKHTLSKLVHIDQKSLGKKTPEDFTFSYISLSDVSSGNISKTLEKHSFKSAPSRARRVLQNGDIIMATVRPNLQGFAKITEEFSHCVASTGFAVLSPKDNVSGEFIYQCLYSYQITKQIESLVVGSNYPAINSSDVAGLHIYTPPYPEQKKIAKILSTWDKAIATTEKLIATSQQQKKALMQQLLTGKKRLVNPDTGKVFEGNWEEVKLSKVCSRLMEKNNGQSDNVVTISAQHGLIRQEEFFKKSVASETLDNYFILRKGQFAYNKSYSNGYPMGAIKRLNRYEDAIVTSLYICFEIKNHKNTSSCFLEQYFESGLLNRGLTKVAAEGGRAHGLLNVKPADFMALSLHIPVFKEQQKIASVLIAADKEIELLQAKLAHLKDEKKALMQQLLTGKRRVKVDENVAA
ncbi:restriction endonuclease subunit S [Proteus mirabilis]|uniref:restriction endonuclease subunit S n=1 Tax=Proteus mirabilis TaxID=584 RepID=UPI002E1523E8|nr:restriction endonuclease subunit S [Proteus mirabilis]